MTTESESNHSALNLEKSSLVLVDVAGTTTSINFVKETLFPFVTTNVEKFLKSKWEEEQIKECIKLIKEDADLDLEAAIEKIKKLTEEKSDNKGLKTIQGFIYKEGYETGELKSHIFDDVPEAFESWASTRRIAIFSTGSLESQKLLFTNTIHGDLSAHIHKYFDQDSGMKTEAETYKKIAKDVEVAPEEIVFITDDVKEATAAKSGGCTAVLIKREGNEELPEEAIKEFSVISSFKELRLDKTAKRKIEEEPIAEEVPPTKLPKTEEIEEKPSEKIEEEKPTEVESMEVDTPVEKETESKETEKPTETEPTPIETEKTETEPEKTETETIKEETTEEVKPEEKMETTDELKSETKVEETEKIEETKIEEPEKIDETKQEETTTAEKIEDKSEGTKVVEETKPDDEKKDDETQSSDEKPAENGDEKPESSTKTEEKENKSVLANGVENGKAEVSNNEAEPSEVQIEEEKTEETEVCVKKLEESAESKTVSVEV